MQSVKNSSSAMSVHEAFGETDAPGVLLTAAICIVWVQAIVISLKDNFFSKADVLVGVTREPQFGASKILSWPLNDDEDAEA